MKKIVMGVFLGAAYLLTACSGNTRISPQYNKSVASIISRHQELFHQYTWDEKSALIERVSNAPEKMLNYLREYDDRPDYSVYSPNPEEMQLIQEYLDILPRGIKRLLQQKLVAIHFINGFIGSGMTDLLFDNQENLFSVIILNPDTLKDTLSERITFRESSAFISDTPDIDIQVISSDKYAGLLYVLLHEATHAYDYIRGTTPYIEEFIEDYHKHKGLSTPRETLFTRGIWKGIKTPVEKNEFQNRRDLTFYGLGGGPKIPLSKCLVVYQGFEHSPFPSLYGAKNWAEDLADMLTFYHITQIMGLEYRISIQSNDNDITSYHPFDNPLVKKRFKTLKVLYR